MYMLIMEIGHNTLECNVLFVHIPCSSGSLNAMIIKSGTLVSIIGKASRVGYHLYLDDFVY